MRRLGRYRQKMPSSHLVLRIFRKAVKAPPISVYIEPHVILDLENPEFSSDDDSLASTLSENQRRESAYIDVKSLLRVLFEAEGEPLEDQIDAISHKLDQWLHADDFDRVDKVFQLLNDEFFGAAMKQLDIPLTLLMVVHGAEDPDTLPHREKLVDRLWSKIVEREGEDRARAYLGTLR